MSGFPLTKFGICPFGGNSVEGTSNADAEIRDTSVRGQTLKWYPRLGVYVCERCIKRLNDDEKSIESAKRHQEVDEFLARAGFTTSVV